MASGRSADRFNKPNGRGGSKDQCGIKIGNGPDRSSVPKEDLPVASAKQAEDKEELVQIARFWRKQSQIAKSQVEYERECEKLTADLDMIAQLRPGNEANGNENLAKEVDELADKAEKLRIKLFYLQTKKSPSSVINNLTGRS